MASTTSTSSMPRLAPLGDASWLRLLQGSIGLGVPSVVVLGYLVLFTTTVDQGDFHHAADYWLTATGLPLAVAGIGIAFGVHRLQHGADGRLGTVGVWVNTVALVELFVQLAASVAVGAELRWGPMYILSTALTFVGTALLAAGSWRSRLAPRWMLGVWPVLWVLGSFAGTGPGPFALAVFLVAFGAAVRRSVRSRS
ncbi:MAG TPA: hypothetical protein VGK60_06480 [Pedococcus sp.]